MKNAKVIFLGLSVLALIFAWHERLESQNQNQVILFKNHPAALTHGYHSQNLSTDSQDVTLFAWVNKIVYTRTNLGQTGWNWTGDRDLFIINDSGYGNRSLATSSDAEYFEGVVSGRIIYSRMVEGTRKQKDIYSVRTHGYGRKALANSADTEEVVTIASGRVIYKRRSSANNWTLYSIKPDGQDRCFLINCPRYWRYKAVVGDYLIFEFQDSNGQYDLWTVKTDGSLQAILAAASENELYAGKLGQWVIFHRLMTNGDKYLYAQQSDGGLDRPIQLAVNQSDATLAGVVESLNRVYYYSPGNNGVKNLMCVRIDGKDRQTVAASEFHSSLFKVYTHNRLVIQNWHLGRDVSSLYCTDWDGANAIPLAQGSMWINYRGCLGEWIIFFDGPPTSTGDVYEGAVYSVNINGSQPVKLIDWLVRGWLESFRLDINSGNIIYRKMVAWNVDYDLYAINPNGLKRYEIGHSNYEEIFQCSTSNRYIFARKMGHKDQWDLFSTNFYGTRERRLATSRYYNEGLPLLGGGPVYKIF